MSTLAPLSTPDNMAATLFVAPGSLGLVENLRDQTEQINQLRQQLDRVYRQKQDLEELYEQSRQERQYLQEMLATVGHELNNPLQSARSFNTFILEEAGGPLSEPQHDLIASSSASIEQAVFVLQDIMSYVQIAQGCPEPPLQSFDLRELLRSSVKHMSLLAQSAELKLELEDLEGQPCLVRGVPHRLRQCLYNLMINAFKFSPTGETVRVALVETAQEYQVMVEDHGCGISPENLGLIFRRRFQVKDNLGRHLAGYGLGLSITKELLERQGGRIWAESTPNFGSRFWFGLPKAD